MSSSSSRRSTTPSKRSAAAGAPESDASAAVSPVSPGLMRASQRRALTRSQAATLSSASLGSNGASISRRFRDLDAGPLLQEGVDVENITDWVDERHIHRSRMSEPLRPGEKVDGWEVRDLLHRDDAERSLQELLIEEDVLPADLLKLKRMFEARGKWEWGASDTTKRLRQLSAIEIAHADPTVEDIAQNYVKAQKNSMTCNWRGRDPEGNVFKCVNTVFRDAKKKQFLNVCAFHVEHCTAPHATGPEAIRFPNDSALCAVHYKVIRGKEPIGYAGMLFVPGVVLAYKAKLHHPLAPAYEPGTDALGKAGVVIPEPPAPTLKERVEQAKLQLKSTAKTALHFLQGNFDEEVFAVRKTAARGSGVAGIAKELLGDEDADGADPKDKGSAKEKTGKSDASGAGGPGASPDKDGSSTATRRRVPRRAQLVRFVPALARKLYTSGPYKKAYNAAATKIQSVVRMHLARRAVQRLRQALARERRHRAARVLQRFFRVLVARSAYKSTFYAYHHAALQIQYWYRMHRYQVSAENDRKYRRAAVRIQRVFRVKRMRALLRLLHQRGHAQAIANGMRLAVVKIVGMVRSWKMRRFARLLLAKTTEARNAANVIHRAYRTYKARQFRRQLLDANILPDLDATMKRSYAARVISRSYRRYFLRKVAREDRAAMFRAARKIVLFARRCMFMRRVKERAMRREFVRQALAPGLSKREFVEMLGSTTSGVAGGTGVLAPPSLSAGPSRMTLGSMPSFVSGVSSATSPPGSAHRRRRRSAGSPRDGVSPEGSRPISSQGSIPVPDTSLLPPAHRFKTLLEARRKAKFGSHGGLAREDTAGRKTAMDAESRAESDEFKQLQDYINRLEAAFQHLDRACTGMLSRPAFQRVMRQTGFEAPKVMMRKLENAFMGTADRVNYKEFIAFARTLKYVCPIHRVLVCPMCLYLGCCRACHCTRFDVDPIAITDIGHMHARLCKCGHHEAQHMPTMKIHDETVVPNPNPFVYKQAVPRASAAAQKLTGLLTPEASRIDIANEAFQPTLATTQATVYEEGSNVLRSTSEQLTSVDSTWSATSTDTRTSRTSVLKEALARVKVATIRAMERKEAKDRRIIQLPPPTGHEARKWNALQAWLDDPDQDEVPGLHRAAEDAAHITAQLEGHESDEYTSAPPASRERGFSSGSRWAAPRSPSPARETSAIVERPEEATMMLESVRSDAARAATVAPPRTNPQKMFLRCPAVDTLRHATTSPTLSERERTVAKRTLEYLEVLGLAYAAGDKPEDDLVGNAARIVALATEHYAILSQYWPDILRDIMYGRVSGGPPGLTPMQRAELDKCMKPQPGRAEYLESVFKTVFSARPAEAHLPVLFHDTTVPLHKTGNKAHAHPRLGRDPSQAIGTARAKSAYYSTVRIDDEPTQPAAHEPARASSPPRKSSPSPQRAAVGSATAVASTKAPAVVSMFHLRPPAGAAKGAKVARRYPYEWRDTMLENIVVPPEPDDLSCATGVASAGTATVIGADATPTAASMQVHLCPFPTCGRLFSHESVLAEHLVSHRLAPAMRTQAEADAYLAPLWKDTPLAPVLNPRARHKLH